MVTGFLGSGKTRLINRFLSARRERALVLVNEIGEEAVDHQLLDLAPGQSALALAGGCLCCAYRGDLAGRLQAALDAPLFADAPPTRLIIETSGLASPVDVETEVMSQPVLAPRLRFAGTVACVDGIDGAEHLAAWREAQIQLALADTVVVTKLDHPDARPAAVRAALEPFGKPAPLGATDIDLAFAEHTLVSHGRFWADDGAALHTATAIERVKLVPAPRELEDHAARLDALCGDLGSSLLRLKGFVATLSGELLAVQIVGGKLYPFVRPPAASGAQPLIVALTAPGGARRVTARLCTQN